MDRFLPNHLCLMDSLIWNCRGAGKRNFATLIKDCKRIYKLDFVAILEPRISGTKADLVLSKLGFDGFVKSDPIGYSGGIWCCWNSSNVTITVLEIKRQCIHLHINPTLQGGWFLTVVYAHPQERQRLTLWEDLIQASNTYQGPWKVTGDFNSVLYAAEKMGGAPINRAATTRFHDCLTSCNLVDLGAKGTPFTWQRGDLWERLDRSVANTSWRTMFPEASVTNIPLPFSDHCALWVRMNAERSSHKPFKFLAS